MGDVVLYYLGVGRTSIGRVLFESGFSSLTEVECQTLLASASVGRLSVVVGALPVVFPVNYRYLGGDVVLSMNDGALRRAIAGNIVTLGVDTADVRDAFWAVYAIGPAHEIIDAAERSEFETLSLATPAPGAHSHYLRIRPEILKGVRSDRREPPPRSEVGSV